MNDDGFSVREVTKRSLESLIIHSGLCKFSRLMRRRIAVLAYHNVVPRGAPLAGERSLHVVEDAFLAQLERLARTHDVVPLRDILASGAARQGSVAAITFDDAYRGALEVGVPAVVKRGWPCTVFVSPGLLGCGSPWWDRLADQSGTLDSRIRSIALGKLHGHQERIIAWAERQGLKITSPPPHARIVSEAELLDVRDPAVELEGHGWLHTNLPSLSTTSVRNELAGTVEWLATNAGNHTPLLAYPYGSVSKRVEAEARRYFESAFLVRGGAFGSRAKEINRFRIPRINVDAGLSSNGLELRASGFWVG